MTPVKNGSSLGDAGSRSRCMWNLWSYRYPSAQEQQERGEAAEPFPVPAHVQHRRRRRVRAQHLPESKQDLPAFSPSGRSMAFGPKLDSSRLPDPSTPKPDRRVVVEAESGVGRDSADPTSSVRREGRTRPDDACHRRPTHGPRVQWRRSQPRVRMLKSRSSLKETSHACSRPAPEQTHHPYHR